MRSLALKGQRFETGEEICAAVQAATARRRLGMPLATPSTGDGGVGTGPAVSRASPLYRQLPELAGWTTKSVFGNTVMPLDPNDADDMMPRTASHW